MLQDIEKKHKDEGLTLLALSIDAPEDQARIPAYLKKNHLDCRVLLAGEEGVRGYTFSAASSMFVIDRKGLLAGFPSQFYFRIEEELGRMLPDLLAGKPTQGPVLWSIRSAPPGFGELWREPLDTKLTSIAIAQGSKGLRPEIGTLDEAHHLKRYSAQGVLESNVELEDTRLTGLRAADLDGDGTPEWIAFNDTGLQVLDGSGHVYWTYDGYDPTRSFEIGGIADLDGDGAREIVVRSGDTVSALRNVPRVLWKNEALVDVKGVRVEGPNSIWVQSGQTVRRLDARGRVTADSFQAPGSALFTGSLESGPSGPLRLFQWLTQQAAATGDLDGDGKKDFLIRSNGWLVVYAQDGSILLSLAIAENQTSPTAVFADLDGNPGDELVVEIPNYGLVALGIVPPATPAQNASK